MGSECWTGTVSPTRHTLLLPQPGLSLWQVPPSSYIAISLSSPYIHPSIPLPWPGLSLWQVPPCILLSGFPSHQPSPLPPTHQGPACHCGRSRPILLFLDTPHYPLLQGPACHCGRSRLVSLRSLLVSTSPAFLLHLPRPGLSLWQVPPSILLPTPTTSLLLPPTKARVVIVAGLAVVTPLIMRLFQSHAGIEHLAVNWNGNPLLLFADLEAKDYARVTQYQFAKAVTTLRQNVTMGLKKGNTVLIHYQYNGILCQAILMMSGSVPGGKGGVDTHKLWKHVLPRSTEFAWLPYRDLAEAFCLPALQLDANRPYGTLMQCTPPQTPRSAITVDQIYFIGDSRSACELEVFINMPIERLRVGCGLQCALPHVPL